MWTRGAKRMNFFSNFIDKCKEKKAELDDRREFQNMVDEKAKPIRRAAYMQQMLKESITEGIAKAKIDAERRIPKKKKTPEDFGINKEDKDQWAFLDKIRIVQENDKEKITKINSKKK